MKTRPTPAGFSDSDATPHTIAQIVQWAVPKGKILTDSVINPHESEVVSVTGYVRLVKLAGDDCDLHIPMSPGPTKQCRRSSRRSHLVRPRRVQRSRSCSMCRSTRPAAKVRRVLECRPEVREGLERRLVRAGDDAMRMSFGRW